MGESNRPSNNFNTASQFTFKIVSYLGYLPFFSSAFQQRKFKCAPKYASKSFFTAFFFLVVISLWLITWCGLIISLAAPKWGTNQVDAVGILIWGLLGISGIFSIRVIRLINSNSLYSFLSSLIQFENRIIQQETTEVLELYFAPLFKKIHASQQRRIYLFFSLVTLQCAELLVMHGFSPGGTSLPFSTKILFIFWDTINILHVISLNTCTVCVRSMAAYYTFLATKFTRFGQPDDQKMAFQVSIGLETRKIIQMYSDLESLVNTFNCHFALELILEICNYSLQILLTIYMSFSTLEMTFSDTLCTYIGLTVTLSNYLESFWQLCAHSDLMTKYAGNFVKAVEENCSLFLDQQTRDRVRFSNTYNQSYVLSKLV